MKCLAVLLVGTWCAVGAMAADAPAPAPTVPSAPVRSSEAEEAWLEIQTSGEPLKMDWKGEKAPGAEDIDAHKRKVAAQLLAEADQAKKFYEKFPEHPKASIARTRETKLREDAAAYGPAPDAKPERLPRDFQFEAKLQEALAQVESVKSLGPVAMARQYEGLGRRLGREYPNREEPWMLMEFATRYTRPAQTVALYREIAESAPKGDFKEHARAELAARDIVNKTISLTGPTLTGEQLDLQKYRGKVVLLDFWATWCPGCVSLTPGLLALYEKYRDQGFEIIGINLDDDIADLKQYVARYKVPWPQISDITQNNAQLSRQFRARSLPTLYLVDKKGKVRDLDPIPHLVEAIQFLLAEQ